MKTVIVKNNHTRNKTCSIVYEESKFDLCLIPRKPKYMDFYVMAGGITGKGEKAVCLFGGVGRFDDQFLSSSALGSKRFILKPK